MALQHTGTEPDIPILFEDGHLLVVEKPAGLLSQADRTGDPDVLSLCKEYLRSAGARDLFLGLVHRLDRPTGGLMMLAKTRRAADDLARQMRDRLVQKTYRVVVFGQTPVNGVLTHWLEKDRSRNVVSARPSPVPDARKAILSFARLALSHGPAYPPGTPAGGGGEPGDETATETLTLLSVHLQTGRPHQIRVQFAAEGQPVWGDYKYGPGSQPEGREMALRAYELVFNHPSTGKQLRFTSPTPGVEPWTLFQRP